MYDLLLVFCRNYVHLVPLPTNSKSLVKSCEFLIFHSYLELGFGVTKRECETTCS